MAASIHQRTIINRVGFSVTMGQTFSFFQDRARLFISYLSLVTFHETPQHRSLIDPGSWFARFVATHIICLEAEIDC